MIHRQPLFPRRYIADHCSLDDTSHHVPCCSAVCALGTQATRTPVGQTRLHACLRTGHTHTHTWNGHADIHIYTRVCTHVYTRARHTPMERTCPHACLHACLHACRHTRLRTGHAHASGAGMHAHECTRACSICQGGPPARRAQSPARATWCEAARSRDVMEAPTVVGAPQRAHSQRPSPRAP